MRMISCRNFCKMKLRKKLVKSSIATGLLVLLFLLLMIRLNDDEEKEKTVIKFCDENREIEKKSLSSFLQPEQDTAIIVPKLIKTNERKFIACFVISSPENFVSRHIIRETWGQLIKPIFLIGTHSQLNITTSASNRSGMTVKQEAEIFDDIIMENFVDTYDNLTLKTGFAMKNFLRYFKKSSFFMKIDDDVLLNVEKLHDTLREAPKNSLIGQLTRLSRPFVDDVDNKWFMPVCVYENEYYPDYLQGPGYIIPGHFVESIFLAAQRVKFFKFEDIFWTGIVAGQNLNMKLHNDKNFKYQFLPNSAPMKFPCLLSEFAAVHKVSLDEMINGWEKLGSANKCSGFMKFFAKIVGWLL